jgi:hypothetical protein
MLDPYNKPRDFHERAQLAAKIARFVPIGPQIYAYIGL